MEDKLNSTTLQYRLYKIYLSAMFTAIILSVPVYIFLAVYILAMLFVLIKFVPVKKFLRLSQPLAVFAVIILAIIFSYAGEHGYFIGKECGQILEELNELILYMTLPMINFYYLWQQKNPSS